MARPLFDSEYIFGIHEPGGEHNMKEMGKPGWIVFTEAIGSDPNDRSGKDFRQWSDQGYGIICRLNNGYEPAGTIPNSSQYSNFARRCANYVAASQGCKIWIIGNETNYRVEWPPLGAARSVAPAAAPAPSGASEAEAEEVRSGGWWRALLRWISGGMGRAELGQGRDVAGEPGDAGEAVVLESAAPEPLSNAQLEQHDPLNRNPQQRFSVIYAEEAAENAAGLPTPAQQTRSGETRQMITPQLYAQCYRLCRDAIHRVPGHSNDQVLVGGVAPWNDNAKYPGNPRGDWAQYQLDILNQLGPNGCDGLTIHTYTHGTDPNLIHDTQKLDSFPQYHYHFFAYKDFMNAIPANMRHLPVYCTETDQGDVPWANTNSGWVQRAYGEINHWNQQPGNQQIRALILYRWPKIDRWFIEGKQGVIDDFRASMQHAYRWNARQVGSGGPVTQPPTTRPPVQPPVTQRPQVPLVAPALNLRTNDKVRTFSDVNLRRTAGHVNKAASDVIRRIPSNTVLQVLSGRFTAADGLVWWFVRATVSASGSGTAGGGVTSVDGWVAQNEPSGATLLRKETATPIVRPPVQPPVVVPPIPVDPTGPTFKKGDAAHTLDIVRMRRTPGTAGKTASDVIGDVGANTTVEIVSGPEVVDGLTWWQVKAPVDGRNRNGWMAAQVGTISLLAAGDAPTVEATFAPSQQIVTAEFVRMRKTPGVRNKPASDVVTDVVPGVTGTVLDGPRVVDNLTWWRVALKDAVGRTVEGWMAESTVTGVPLLAAAGPTGASGPEDDGGTGVVDGGGRGSEEPDGNTPSAPNEGGSGGRPVVAPPPSSTAALFQKGDLAQTQNVVRMRKTAGFIGKPESDVVAELPLGTTVKVVDGPTAKDNLTWWRVETKGADGATLRGWMADAASAGPLLVKVDGGEQSGGPSVPPAVSGKFKAGQAVETVNFVRMRKTPGYFDKPDSDVVADLGANSVGVVVDGPVAADELVWWQVRTRDGDDRAVTGWMAEAAANGVALLRASGASTGGLDDDSDGRAEGDGSFDVGDLLVAQTEVRVRATPGHLNQPNSDVVGFYRERTTLNFVAGPQEKDGLSWLRVGGISPGGEVVGWVAEEVNGRDLVGNAALLPGTGVPNREKGLFIGAPTRTPFGIAQLWGENPDFYKRFAPAGVPLLGHNGIDFLTPIGTDVLAVDSGQVVLVRQERSGFGNWVLLKHSWGRSIYAHLNSINVRFGQSVGRGALIGKSGNTGTSTGPHLHFAIARNPFVEGDGWGGFIDPLPYLPPRFVLLPRWVLGPQPQGVAAAGESRSTTVDRLEPSGVSFGMPE